jgi:glutathione synthase
MDPAEKMLVDRDTTYALIRSAQNRGHDSWHCLPVELFNRGRDLWARARPIRVRDTPPHIELGLPVPISLVKSDAVFLRKDPPFDRAYLYLTQQLDLVKDATLVINDPRGVRDANEKLFAFHFAQFMPPSLVSADPPQILDFIRRSGPSVLKPLDGAGGSGVVRVSVDDKNTRSLIDLLTREGRRLALVQEYLPAIETGDKRVLVLDGELLGAILRVPRDDDLRANIHAGGRVEATALDAAESALVREVGKRLKQDGLWFVGLDLIGGKLIEVNVTSPTGIQELGRLTGGEPEGEVLAFVERKAAEIKAAFS